MTRIANQDFTLTRDDCRPVYFVAGQEIPAEYEAHWWVLLHSDESASEDVAIAEEKRKPGRPTRS